jgi:hypothetical protein
MPYAPEQQFRGDEYLYRGLSQLGAGIGALGGDLGEAIQEHKKEMDRIREQRQFNLQVYQQVKQTHPDILTTEDEQKFHEGNVKDQNGLVHGWMIRMADDMKQEMALSKMDAATAKQEAAFLRIENARQKQAMMGQPAYAQPVPLGSQPPPADVAQKYGLPQNPQVGVWTGEGAIHPLPQQAIAPQYTEIPTRPGQPPIRGIMTPKGGFQQEKAGKVSQPKLTKDEQIMLGWAMNRVPTPKNLVSKLPSDLQTLAKKAIENPNDPRANLSWNKIKAEIIRRSTTQGESEVESDSGE